MALFSRRFPDGNGDDHDAQFDPRPKWPLYIRISGRFHRNAQTAGTAASFPVPTIVSDIKIELADHGPGSTEGLRYCRKVPNSVSSGYSLTLRCGFCSNNTLRAEDDEAGVVRNQMQALKLKLRRPADPAVTVSALEGASLPPGKRNPISAPFDDVAQAASGEELEAEAMVPRDGCIPPHTFMRPCEANHDSAKREAVGWRFEEG